MSSAALVAEKPFTFGGQVFTLARPTLGTELAYTHYLEARNIAKLRSHRADWAEDYPAALEAANRDNTVGVYEWGTKEWSRSTVCPEHLAQLAYLCFLQRHPDMPRAQFQKLWEGSIEQTDRGRLNHVGEALIELLNVPNSTTPEATAATGATTIPSAPPS